MRGKLVDKMDNIYPMLKFMDAYFWWILIIVILVSLFMYMRYFGPIIVTYKLLNKGAYEPTRAYGKAACMDMYVAEGCEVKAVPPGQWRSIATDIAFAPWPHIYLPFINKTFTPFGNVAGKIHTRSGMALKKGIRAHLGIIDNDWRGTWDIMLYNHGTYALRIRPGDKIGQIEFYRVPHTILWKRKKLTNTRRGTKGFGSSGMKHKENNPGVDKNV